MMTVAQIDRMLAYSRDEYVNRLVSVLLTALRYVYEARLTDNRRRRASLVRASRQVLDNAFMVEMLHEIRFNGRRGAFSQAVAEARECEARLKRIVETRARRPDALADMEASVFWRSVPSLPGSGSRKSRV